MRTGWLVGTRAAYAVVLSSGLWGCQPTAEHTLRQALQSALQEDPKALTRHVAESYLDPLGNRGTLLADIATLRRENRAHHMRLEDLTTDENLSGRQVDIGGRLTLELIGFEDSPRPNWHFAGPIRVHLMRDAGPYRIRSGFLPNLRGLMKALKVRARSLTARDLQHLSQLLHPKQRAWTAEALNGLIRCLKTRAPHRVTHYRIDLRPHLAHIDAFLRTTRTSTRQAMTLRPSAGHWRFVRGLWPPLCPRDPAPKG